MNMIIKLAHGFANLEKNHYGSYLHLVMVDPEYRGNGIATRLMTKVLDNAPKRLVAFYSRFGFKKQRQRKHDSCPYNFNMVLY